MKTISMIVLICFMSAITSPAYAVEEKVIQFDLVTSQKLDADIKFCRDNTINIQKKLDLCTSDVGNANGEVKLLKQKSDTLVKDLDLSLKATESYKTLYTKADEERLKAIENAPSRMTWFGAGAVSAVVIGLIAIIFIKK